MKRCVYCLSECPDNAKSCTVCGFSGVMEKQFENCLSTGTKLNNRYILGGVFSKEKVFVSYYAFDAKTSKRVKISEYLNENLTYRHSNELIVKFRNEQCLARGEKEIAAYYAHYRKLCTAAEKSVLNFTDCFAENSTIYFVNSIDNGTPLSSLTGNGKTMPYSKAIQLVKPLIDCAAALEKVGKWHGSISPYSIITENGRIVSVSGYTFPPKNAYSPFDAPEKKLGARECGVFTDIYAISAIIYEAVTGIRPPNSEQRNQGIPLSFPANFPENEKRAIEKGLALDKNERFSGVEEFYSALKGKTAVKEKLPRSEITRRITLAFAILCFMISGGILINSYIVEPCLEAKQSSEMASMVQTTSPENQADPWLAIKRKYPEIDFPEGMNPAFSELYAANRDFAGWISIPEMNINYAVVQGKDNKEYERKDFYKNSTNYGVPFFDFRNSLHNLDRNTIIFGHNMRRDDKLFGTLEQYRTVEGFAKAPLIGMSTLFGDYTFKIYAVYITNSNRSDDNGNFLNYIFTNTTDENFANYIAEVDKRKLYDTGVDIRPTDKILTLSTCCYDFSDARLVVVGRLLRDGENPAVDTSLAAVNPSPKFPQAYYKANGESNPYKNDVNLFNE